MLFAPPCQLFLSICVLCLDVLLSQVYLPYALGFCFSENCFMLRVSLSPAVFNWRIDSDTLSIRFFFSVLCVT